MPKFLRLLAFIIVLFFVTGFAECYKPVTKNQLPSHIKTVAVPAFQNNALRYKIGSRFADAVANEPIHRQRFHGTMASIAAAVLKGAHLIRVHDVRAAVETARVSKAIG